MKKVLIGFAVILIVVIGAGIYLYSNLGDIIKAAVEEYGSDATQATVSLNGVDLDVTSGKAGLSGFVVGNPSGFETPSAFELGAIAVQIDPSSLDTDTIVIKSVAINAPKVTYELGGSGSNIDAIQSNVDAYAKRFGGGGGGSSSSGGNEKKLVIERLTITGGEVNVSAAFLGGKTLGTPLPDITLTDIGKDSGGASPAEVIQQVIDSMTSGIGSAVGTLNLDGLAKEAEAQAKKALEGVTSGATDAVKSATEGAGAAGDAASDAVKGAGDAASDAVKGAGDALKGLLGN